MTHGMRIRELIEKLSTYDPEAQCGVAFTGQTHRAFPIQSVYRSEDDTIVLDGTSFQQGGEIPHTSAVPAIGWAAFIAMKCE